MVIFQTQKNYRQEVARGDLPDSEELQAQEVARGDLPDSEELQAGSSSW